MNGGTLRKVIYHGRSRFGLCGTCGNVFLMGHVFDNHRCVDEEIEHE